MLYILESAQHELVSMVSCPGSNWGLDFSQGRRLEEHFGNGQIFIDFASRHEVLPDYFEVDSIPVVSDRFLRMWRTVTEENYQVFPISARFPDGNIKRLYIINIIGRVACFDLEHGEYKIYDGMVSRIKNLIIQENISVLPEIFRADEYPLAIFVSERAENIIASSGLSGFVLSASLNWNDDHRF